MNRPTPILIVDDDRTIRKLLERVARRAGFDSDSAKDGVEALEMMQKKRYDIAIVDLMMPRLSGYELVQKMSQLNPRPVVLVATAMANGDVANLDDSMVRRVIRKPFDIEAVARALVETAKQIADQQEHKEHVVPVAPPEAAVIPVIVNPSPETMAAAEEEASAAVEEKPATDTPPPIEEPPKETH